MNYLEEVCSHLDGQIPHFNNTDNIEKVYNKTLKVFQGVDPLKESKCFFDDYGDKVAFWLGLKRNLSDGNWMSLYQDDGTFSIKDFVGGHKCIFMQGKLVSQKVAESFYNVKY